MENNRCSSEHGGWGHWVLEGDLAAPAEIESRVNVSCRVYVPYRLSSPERGGSVAFALDVFASSLPSSVFKESDLRPEATAAEVEANYDALALSEPERRETYEMIRQILWEHSYNDIAERKWSCMTCGSPASDLMHTVLIRRQILDDDDSSDLDDLADSKKRTRNTRKTCLVVVDVAVPICLEKEACEKGGDQLAQDYTRKIMYYKDILVECPVKEENEAQKPFNNPTDMSQPGLPMFKNCRFCRNLGATFTCAACRKVGYCSFECQHEHWPEHKHYCSPPPPDDPNRLPLLISWLIGDNKHHYSYLEAQQQRYADVTTQSNQSKWFLNLCQGQYFTFNGQGDLTMADPWADIGIEDRVIGEDEVVTYGEDSQLLVRLKLFGDEEAPTERAASEMDQEATGLWQPPPLPEPEPEITTAEQRLWQPPAYAGRGEPGCL